MIFKAEEHENFYVNYLAKCKNQDVFHKALLYCLGIHSITRQYIHQIYDFKSDEIKTECLKKGWQTDSSVKNIRLAFNLYTNLLPTVYEEQDRNRQLDESRNYSVSELFCTSDAKFMLEAIKLRLPEYFAN